MKTHILYNYYFNGVATYCTFFIINYFENTINGIVSCYISYVSYICMCNANVVK